MRLLVLGEGHYSRTPEASDFTQRLTNDWIAGAHNHRFWTVVPRLIAGRHLSRPECVAVWNSLAFYNYVQEIVGPSARVRPTPEMWERAKEPFREALGELSPQAVLVLGKGLWSNLPKAEVQALPVDAPGSQIARLRVDTHTMVGAAFVNHPASVGFSWRKWHPAVVELRKSLEAGRELQPETAS